MSDLRVSFGKDKIGRTYSRSVARERDRVLASMRGTAAAEMEEGLRRGRENIRSASSAFGKSKRWAPGLVAQKTEGGGTIKVVFRHLISYFMVHQEGAVIHGKPLLAIPLSFAKDAQGIWARDFPEPLFRVDRKGKNSLLFSAADKKPKYVLVDKVVIPKRFRVVEIIRDVTRKAQDIYRKQFRLNKDVGT